MKSILVLMAVLTCLPLWAEDEAAERTLSETTSESEVQKLAPEEVKVPEEVKTVPETKPEARGSAPEELSGSSTTVRSTNPALSPSLAISSRFDVNYSGGGAVAQGFSIPYARLSAFGEAGGYIRYRFSLGQTREFSTALLPQMLPVEAFVDASTVRSGNDNEAYLRVRFGLFAPQMNPWWTPDLSEIRMPDYHETHKALFLSREIGVEATFSPLPGVLELGVGYVNGSGIFTLNTNNSKAFTGFAKLLFAFGSTKAMLGVGGYSFTQSTKGTVNYKTSSAIDGFFEIDFTSIKAKLQADVFSTKFEDSTRSLAPTGAAFTVHLGVTSWATLFARYESSTQNPLLSGRIRQFQAGPIFDLSSAVTAYTTYGFIETGGSTENVGQIRLRLAI